MTKTEPGGCGSGAGHEWAPTMGTISGPVDVASLDWECRRCGEALLDEEQRDELNGQVRDVAQEWERRRLGTM